MDFNELIVFFFSTLGVFNGIILALYFMFNKEQRKIPSRFFLGFFMIMITLRLLKSVGIYFNNSLDLTFVQFGLMACFMIGPAFFVYILSCYFSTRILEKWKTLLFILLGFIIAFGLLFSYSQNIEIWRKHVIKYIFIFWFSSIFISIITFFVLYRKRKEIVLDRLLLPVFYCTIVVCGTYFYAFITNSRPFYISGSILFTLFLYLNFFLFFPKKDKTVLEATEKDKYANRKISEEYANEWLDKLYNLVSKEELYKNPNLKINDLASRMKISSHQLSQLLNDNLGKSFNNYINEFRIEKACEKILTDSHLKIEEIGYEVGFNSKSTFFTTFKKVKKTTPLLYRTIIS